MQTEPEAGWYRGDCHIHSLHSSGGELTPEQAADAARAVGLDFIVGVEPGQMIAWDHAAARSPNPLWCN